MRIVILAFLSAVWVLTQSGCSRQEPQYVIGVSQCSGDIWRDKQNAELRMGTYFQDDVELRFAAAYDSDERQVQQIDSLVASGIDLLIVAPNQVQTISPAIDRAYDSGIPVIVFERKTNSQKYTAFMSADNYEMGRVMGEYIISRLGGKGHVLEIRGLEGSSPAIDRHNGFIDALKKAPGINLVASLQGDWTEPLAQKTVKHWLNGHSDTPVDLVFGMNDRTAMGARAAFLKSGRPLPLFCGIDGLPGENGGIRLVRDSILDASYIYPTHGDRLLQLAVQILKGEPYEKETRLQSALVTHDNAAVLLMQTDETLRQAANLDALHEKADIYMHRLDTQRTITLLACIVIALLLVAIVFFYRYHISQITLRQERVVNTLWNMKPDDTEREPQTPVETRIEPVAESSSAEGGVADGGVAAGEPDGEDGGEPTDEPSSADDVVGRFFIARFREVVERRLTDSEVSVEDLAADMNLSRVQLYRKVKAVTQSTPVELLRSARLDRGYQLLLTTDKSVSEVAYEVGFTAPSYFTKCFKEKYGKLPGDVRQG